jgi:hypothetical protein
MAIPPPLASRANLNAHARSDLRIQPPVRCNRPTSLQDGYLDPVPFNYPYDHQGQLTADGMNTYDYDLNGNRDTGYTTGDDNRLEDDGTWTYDYDDEGNLIEKTDGTITWTYGYDHRNHLISAEKAVSGTDVVLTAEYRYDAFANCIEAHKGGREHICKYVRVPFFFLFFPFFRKVQITESTGICFILQQEQRAA